MVIGKEMRCKTRTILQGNTEKGRSPRNKTQNSAIKFSNKTYFKLIPERC